MPANVADDRHLATVLPRGESSKRIREVVVEDDENAYMSSDGVTQESCDGN